MGRLLGIVVLAASTGGCGTLYGMTGALFSNPHASKVYVGTRLHLRSLGDEDRRSIFGLLTYLDIPLSLALDTLLLPFTVPWSLAHAERARRWKGGGIVGWGYP